jgi:hypothetical protein
MCDAGGWNYRLVRVNSNTKKRPMYWLEIREVYYDPKDKPCMISVNGNSPGGEDMKTVRADIRLMTSAFKKPVLDYETLEEVK